MQLIYRGVSYQSITPELVDAKQQPNLKYRGISYQIPKAKNQNIADIHVLKYRGIDFVKVLNH